MLKNTHVIAYDGPQNGTYLPLNQFIKEDYEKPRFPLGRNMDDRYYELDTGPTGEQIAMWVGDDE